MSEPSLPAPADRPGEVWAATVRVLGGRADQAVDGGADLERRYAEPHRRYHSAEHIRAVLRDTRRLAADLGLGQADLPVLLLAACAHDVVYDARPGDDERASADWARARLSAAGVDPNVRERVAGLVLATLAHEAEPGDRAAPALLDADLAILAAAPDAYGRYVSAVRFEYTTVTDDQWRTGRAAVLRSFRDRPFIYATEPARAWWETAARTNLAAELATLEGQR